MVGNNLQKTDAFRRRKKIRNWTENLEKEKILLRSKIKDLKQTSIVI